ncbi:unnamed protein product [Durusdinium trenchii]|uniref:Uncharacterized protein n=1 Tax=Durusdinium trenchii TaxID=1381693 RepID=A0ABP0M633_9DINO
MHVEKICGAVESCRIDTSAQLSPQISKPREEKRHRKRRLLDVSKASLNCASMAMSEADGHQNSMMNSKPTANPIPFVQGPLHGGREGTDKKLVLLYHKTSVL